MNISQIKHIWFSFVFLFVTDLSNYNAVVFIGKRRARMEGVQAFILSMKRESQNKAYTESPTKNIRNLPSTIKKFMLRSVFDDEGCKTVKLVMMGTIFPHAVQGPGGWFRYII